MNRSLHQIPRLSNLSPSILASWWATKVPEAPLDWGHWHQFTVVRYAEFLPLLVLDLVIRAPIFEGISGPPWVFLWASSFQLLEFPGAQIKREVLVEDSTWRESSGKGGWNRAVRGVVRV